MKRKEGKRCYFQTKHALTTVNPMETYSQTYGSFLFKATDQLLSGTSLHFAVQLGQESCFVRRRKQWHFELFHKMFHCINIILWCVLFLKTVKFQIHLSVNTLRPTICRTRPASIASFVGCWFATNDTIAKLLDNNYKTKKSTAKPTFTIAKINQQSTTSTCNKQIQTVKTINNQNHNSTVKTINSQPRQNKQHASNKFTPNQQQPKTNDI